jgi:hypothetical protein
VTGDVRLAARLSLQARVAARRADRAARLEAAARARWERAALAARRRLPVRLAGAAVAAVLTVPEPGASPVLWLVAGALSVGAARSWSVLRSAPPLPRLALPVAPPPPRGSAAWPYVRRLENARASLARMLPLVTAAGREAAAEAAQAAHDAEGALRWQAARLAAVEPHRGTEPDLLGGLEHGVAAQERLVAAVADLVAAGADPFGAARLHDAADRLHGLAAGLRDVQGQVR